MVGKRKGRLSLGGDPGVAEFIQPRDGGVGRRVRGGPSQLRLPSSDSLGWWRPSAPGSGRGTGSHLGWTSAGGLRGRRERRSGPGPPFPLK